MADPFLDDLPQKTPKLHEIGQDLSTLSIGELDERIALLHTEITRLEAIKRQKETIKSAAADFFKPR